MPVRKSESGHDNDQNAWNRGTSNANLTWADHSRVDWHYIAPGKPMQNAFIESLNGRLRRGTQVGKEISDFRFVNVSRLS
jgi:transposase InsO family protein